MSIEKPENPLQMRPPFERVGDPEWNTGLRELLVSFDVPLPEPSTDGEIRQCERALEVKLPDSVCRFLLEFGPVSFDYVQILAPSQIRKATELWFTNTPVENLDDFFTIANAGTPDNQFVLHIQSGECYLARHDSDRLKRCLGSFDDLIRIACVDLYTSYYGWDDDQLLEWRNDTMRTSFGFVL